MLRSSRFIAGAVFAGMLTWAASLASCKAVRSSPSETASEAAVDSELTPAPVPVARVVFRIPNEREIKDSVVLASIRRGRALARDTRDSLPTHVGGGLQCVSCHPNDATMPNAMPWIGVYARFPQYRSRNGTIILLEDRINDCFRRSLNGTPLSTTSRDMRDLIAYMAFLSNGYPTGAHVEGESLPQLKPLTGDTTHAKLLFATTCTPCHGPGGQGTTKAPPLWGPRSYNIGAGMARRNTLAAFIKQVMPQNNPGTLSVQDAYDLAAFITTRPRPDFPGKELDWPKGDPPADIPYQTRAVRKLRESVRQARPGREASPPPKRRPGARR
jgi:thiosulfate dehydrogenase